MTRSTVIIFAGLGVAATRLPGDRPLQTLSLADWNVAFTHLPCLDDMPEPPQKLYKIHTFPDISEDVTVIPGWPAYHSLVRDYLELSQAELSKAQRWPVPGSDGLRELPQMRSEQIASLRGSGIMPHLAKVLVPAGSRIAVFGDLHGAAHSFLRELAALQALGFLDAGLHVTSEHAHDFYMVFCGDYVDRGVYGVEVLALLLTLRLKNPHNVFASRGNHEDRAMNDYEGGTGGFTAELRRKFPGVSEGDLDDVFRVYETLPVALFIGVVPAVADRGAAVVSKVEGASVDAIGVPTPNIALGSDGALPTAYLMAVHGGIEVGVDAWDFLNDVRITHDDIIPRSTAQSIAPSNDEDSTGGGAYGLYAGARGPVIQYSAIDALRRRDWYDTRPPEVQARISERARGVLENLGRKPAFWRARVAGRKYAGASDAAGEFPLHPMEYSPSMGFMWNDFFVSDTSRYLEYNPGRGLVFGHDLVQHWLNDNRIAGILRAHQHNDSPGVGPMLSNVRRGRGVHDNWGGSGMVLTFLSGGHIPYLDFLHDSFGLLDLPSEQPTSWRLDHCQQRSEPQLIRVPDGGVSGEPGKWYGGRVPPSELQELSHQPGALSFMCNPSVSRMACKAHAWQAGGFTPTN